MMNARREASGVRRKGLLLLISCLIIAPGFSQAESLDSRWYHQIHDRWHSSTLDPVMKSATNAGEATVAIAACLAVETFGRKREKESAKLGVVALGASGLVTELLKGAVNRQRPDGNTSGRWDSSFPSGHATGAFAAALITAERYHKLAIPAYLGATVVGLSRIYLGRHYPSDVVTGAAIGTASAILVLKFQKPILKFEL
jgi:undecaprenyl-diphosphatase